MSSKHTSSFEAIFKKNSEHSLVDLEGETSDWAGDVQKKEKSSPS